MGEGERAIVWLSCVMRMQSKEGGGESNWSFDEYILLSLTIVVNSRVRYRFERGNPTVLIGRLEVLRPLSLRMSLTWFSRRVCYDLPSEKKTITNLYSVARAWLHCNSWLRFVCRSKVGNCTAALCLFKLFCFAVLYIYRAFTLGYSYQRERFFSR